MQSKDALRAQLGVAPKDTAVPPSGPNGNGHEKDVNLDRILSFQDILEAPDVGEMTVPVPQWRGSVVIRGLSREEFLRCKAVSTDAKGNLEEAKFEKNLLVMSLVKPALNHNTISQIYAKDVAAIGVIVKAIMTHLGADAESIKRDQDGDNAGFGDAL